MAFIEALGSDFASQPLLDKATPLKRDEAGFSQWVNGSVDTFLEAAAAWATASARSSPSSSKTNIWQRRASILLAGKFYE
ncbi:hypothetical protein [Pseudomonas sp. H3_G09]